jgi:hypothetical protein
MACVLVVRAREIRERGDVIQRLAFDVHRLPFRI